MLYTKKGGGDQVIEDKNQFYQGVDTTLFYKLIFFINLMSFQPSKFSHVLQYKKIKTEIIEIERDFVIALFVCKISKFKYLQKMESFVCTFNYFHYYPSISHLRCVCVCFSWSSLLFLLHVE